GALKHPFRCSGLRLLEHLSIPLELTLRQAHCLRVGEELTNRLLREDFVYGALSSGGKFARNGLGGDVDGSFRYGCFPLGKSHTTRLHSPFLLRRNRNTLTNVLQISLPVKGNLLENFRMFPRHLLERLIHLTTTKLWIACTRMT